MSTFTKEQLIEKLQHRVAVTDSYPDVEEAQLDAAIFKIALASLEAEPVAWTDTDELRDVKNGGNGYLFAIGGEANKFADPRRQVMLYTTPPVPTVPNECPAEIRELMASYSDALFDDEDAQEIWNACRAAMLQGADTELQRKAAIHDALCEKYNVESLSDFVEWQRNHIAELEAAPPAPVGEGEMAVMPDYPGYTMTQRECYQAGKSAGLAELVKTAYTLPPHTYRELVNRLRDTAVKYQGCQQLREQLSRTLQEVIEPAVPQQEVKP